MKEGELKTSIVEEKRINGLTVDDWELTMSQLKSQLNSSRIQEKVVIAGIDQCLEEIKKYET